MLFLRPIKKKAKVHICEDRSQTSYLYVNEKKSYMLRYGMQCLHKGFHGSSTFAVTLINNLAALTLGSIKYVEVVI